ncbi:MAG: hypothetical protein LIO76_09900, partial [Clostridiales bacterium]|nr:hypothetical protein [Clostridiales bacterium]
PNLEQLGNKKSSTSRIQDILKAIWRKKAMRVLDALEASRPGKARQTRHNPLTTVWGEHLDPEHILQEYPRPQLRRKTWICLNGTWQYAITRSGSRPRHAEGDILVPFSPETRASGVNRRLKPGEYLWYQRSVNLPVLPDGQRLLLHFGAVDQSCTVWWNGRLVGRNESGYLPFSFDVTEEARQGKICSVSVCGMTRKGAAAAAASSLLPPAGCTTRRRAGSGRPSGWNGCRRITSGSLRSHPILMRVWSGLR